MDWTEPQYSPKEVDEAGQALRQTDSRVSVPVVAYDTVSNWRASHAFPLNTFQVVLRRRARSLDPDALIAQRLKRVPSIAAKLRKQNTMRLSQMQDIGGCRAVLRTAVLARGLRDLYISSASASALVGTKDYVATPRSSGYRSYHLIYRYRCSDGGARAVFDGHLIEIQLRSQLQHAWATAVETAGTLINQALKSSSGPEEWQEFFRLTSSLFAYRERTPPLSGAPPRSELVRLVQTQLDQLHVAERLRAFSNAIEVIDLSRERESRYFLLVLRTSPESLNIQSFREGQVAQAADEYLRAEQAARSAPGTDVVLVRADSIDALKRAYPNYFLDTDVFLQTLDTLLRAR